MYRLIHFVKFRVMYRQILMHPSDRDLQRIVWRSNVCAPIGEYKLNTLTFGTAPASYIATKCLHVLGHSVAVEKPVEPFVKTS